MTRYLEIQWIVIYLHTFLVIKWFLILDNVGIGLIIYSSIKYFTTYEFAYSNRVLWKDSCLENQVLENLV